MQKVVKWLHGIFSKPAPLKNSVEKGILLYHSTGEVIKAETLLIKAGLDIAVKGPPPDLRQGCDMVIEFPLIHELHIRTILESAKLEPLRIVVLNDHLLEPVSLFHVKDFGEYIMVRAANMKITVEKQSRLIVNISGGGCPDVPYLAHMLTGKTIDQAPEPRLLGQTLCSYALQLAFKEVQRLCPG